MLTTASTPSSSAGAKERTSPRTTPEAVRPALSVGGERVAEVEAVDDRDPVALIEQGGNEDRPDVPGAAGDEEVH